MYSRAIKTEEQLPASFQHLFWSYEFSKLNAKKDKKLIIIQIINYGDLRQWSWMIERYGLAEVKDILSSVSESEIKPRTRKLLHLLFSINSFSHVPRSANR